MTGKAERSPSPSEVGFTISRRNFVIGAAALGGAAMLGACGDDDEDDGAAPAGAAAPGATDAPGATSAPGTAAAPATTAAAAGGEVTFGSNYSDEKPKAGMAAALATTGVNVKINTTDHNTYQQNFNTYIQQPDDVISWFAGYRMRAFASKGVVGDVSDVWAGITGMSEGFKSASSGLDGKQYFVPFYFYPWAVHYRKSLFEEKGYTVPVTWDEFKALCEQMQTDGLIPLCRRQRRQVAPNGHVRHAQPAHQRLRLPRQPDGRQGELDRRQVKAVFSTWDEILPYYQEGVNGRTWQDAANGIGDKSAGMYLLGTFVTSNFDGATQQAIIDDIDFFAFPEINAEHGQDAVEAPIDGFMMAASRRTPRAPRRC